MPIRRGLKAPQNVFIEAIIKKFDGPGLYHFCIVLSVLFVSIALITMMIICFVFKLKYYLLINELIWLNLRYIK